MSLDAKVKEIIVDQLGVNADEVTNEASFIDDLGADSLDTVELVMALEEEFNMEIPDEEAEKIKTVGDAIEFIMAGASAVQICTISLVNPGAPLDIMEGIEQFMSERGIEDIKELIGAARC